jgi:hypothetical protein
MFRERVRWGRGGAFACAIAVAMQLPAARAAAEDIDPSARAAARSLGYAGVDAFERREYGSASDKLEKAFAVLRVPSIGLWSARAFARLGRLVQASERYRLVGTLPTSGGETAVQLQAQADAARELGELLPRIPSLVVVVDGGAPSQVTVDDSPVPSSLVGEAMPLNPGSHRLVARRGDETASADVALGESEHKRVVLRLARATPRPVEGARTTSDGSQQKAIGIAGLAIGGAALAAGAVTGILAAGKKSSFDSNPACANDACPSSLQSEIDVYNRLRFASTLSFVAGGVLAGTGGILLLTLPKSQERVSLRAAPGSVAIFGSF